MLFLLLQVSRLEQDARDQVEERRIHERKGKELIKVSVI